MKNNKHRFFTSESVTEGHPDKMCDQISDAILDAILALDPDARVACETVVCTGTVFVMGQITTTAVVDYARIVRDTVRDIGYTRAKYGFDADSCGVIISLDKQSPDIAGYSSRRGSFRRISRSRRNIGPLRRGRPRDDVRLCLQRNARVYAYGYHSGSKNQPSSCAGTQGGRIGLP